MAFRSRQGLGCFFLSDSQVGTETPRVCSTLLCPVVIPLDSDQTFLKHMRAGGLIPPPHFLPPGSRNQHRFLGRRTSNHFLPYFLIFFPFVFLSKPSLRANVLVGRPFSALVRPPPPPLPRLLCIFCPPPSRPHVPYSRFFQISPQIVPSIVKTPTSHCPLFPPPSLTPPPPANAVRVSGFLT